MKTTKNVPNQESITIPPIKWYKDSHKLTWSLLSELEKDENRPLFFGKVNKSDNTNGDTKEKVFKRIAAAMFKEEYAIAPRIMADRVKQKINWLFTTYKTHEKRLRVTGEGIGNIEDEDALPQVSELQFYIHAGGPDENTPPTAVNIWNKIIEIFPFFPRLHRYLSSRPNVVPIVVATPLGPQGGRTTWFQPPVDNSVVDPALLEEDISIPDRQPVAPSGLNSESPVCTPLTPTATGPRPSSSFREALSKAARVVPQKRNIGESMLEIARSNLDVLKNKAAKEESIQIRRLLLDEYQAGIWSKDEYKKRIDELEGDERRAKRRRLSQEWDDSLFDEA